jgi:hypothetical protein
VKRTTCHSGGGSLRPYRHLLAVNPHSSCLDVSADDQAVP